MVLAHMRPADQRSWFDFADRLADQGYQVLTFDFRGTCPGGDGGCSEGEADISSMWQDVVGAVTYLRSRGADRVGLVGASMGGTASLVAAAQPGVDPRMVVTLSAPTEIEGLAVDARLLSSISGPGSCSSPGSGTRRRRPPPRRCPSRRRRPSAS